MKTLLIYIFSICFTFLVDAQDFRYFIPDTVSPYVFFLKVKGEDQWGNPSSAKWHWRKERQFIEDMEEQVFKMAFKEVNSNQIPALTQVEYLFVLTKHSIFSIFIFPFLNVHFLMSNY